MSDETLPAAATAPHGPATAPDAGLPIGPPRPVSDAPSIDEVEGWITAQARGDKLTQRQLGYIGVRVRDAKKRALQNGGPVPANVIPVDFTSAPGQVAPESVPPQNVPVLAPQDVEEIVEGVLNLADDIIQRIVERRAVALAYSKEECNDAAAAVAMQPGVKRTFTKTIPMILAKRGLDAANLPEFACISAAVAYGSSVLLVMREFSEQAKENLDAERARLAKLESERAANIANALKAARETLPDEAKAKFDAALQGPAKP